MCDVPRGVPASERLDARSGDRAADRALPQHPDRLSTTRHGRISAVPVAARPERAHVSNHARQWHDANIHHVGSGTPVADRSDRRSRSDGHHTAAWNQQNGTVLSQQFSRDARRGAGPLRRVLQARGKAQPAAKPATDPLVERSRDRSRVRDAGGETSLARVPPKALISALVSDAGVGVAISARILGASGGNLRDSRRDKSPPRVTRDVV